MAISSKSARKLRNIYLDETILVYLQDMNVVTVNEEQGEIKIAMVAEGYCLDIDENFIYLGLPDGTITKTINHDLGLFIEIAYAGEIVDFDMPTDGDTIN